MEASTEKHDFPELFEKLDNLDLSGHFLQSLPNATGDYFGQYTAPISEISVNYIHVLLMHDNLRQFISMGQKKTLLTENSIRWCLRLEIIRKISLKRRRIAMRSYSWILELGKLSSASI